MDESSVRALLEQHHVAGYGWALSCCSRDPGLAEDVLQTVYLKILQGKARYNGRALFRTWLFSVIRKTAAEERRRSFLRRLKLREYHRQTRQTHPQDSSGQGTEASEDLSLVYRFSCRHLHNCLGTAAVRRSTSTGPPDVEPSVPARACDE